MFSQLQIVAYQFQINQNQIRFLYKDEESQESCFLGGMQFLFQFFGYNFQAMRFDSLSQKKAKVRIVSNLQLPVRKISHFV